jgi:hypothetical protein
LSIATHTNVSTIFSQHGPNRLELKGHTIMRILKLLALTTLPLFAAPAVASPDNQPRDLTIEQAGAAQIGSPAGMPRPGSLQVSLAADRADATYAIGETVRLMLTANEDAYVTVLDIGPGGQVTQLFPNQYQPDNHLFAGAPVEIGGGNSGARVTVAGPVGAELVKVIATSRPVTVVSESQLAGGGAYPTVNGGVQAVLRNLQVVADQATQGDTRIAWQNVPLRTIAGRAAPALIVIPGQQAAAMPVLPAAPLAAVPAQPPLLIALDRPSYRIGDRVTIAVTAVQPCNLTVLDFATSGQVRTLFPSPAAPGNVVGAMQTVLMAGGPSAITLPVSGPPGTEQIVAICSTDAAPAMASYSPSYSLGADRAAVMRDLTVAAARPAGVAAFASATFTVQP